MFRSILRVAAVSFSLGFASPTANAAPPEPAPKIADQVRIEVEGDWKAAPAENVQKTLVSTAENLLRYCPERRLGTILVRRNSGPPITLYEKGPKGEHQIRLSAEDTYWSQYAYQFSHELGHVLCNYDQRPHGRHLWFEEALCETASLFTLRKMSVAWKTDPPYANWAEFAPHLYSYVDALLARRDRRLPPDRTMPEWYREHAAALGKQRELTADSKLVAPYLLDLFEDEPTGWAALATLNRGPEDADLDFPAYLAAWKARSPAAQQPFIGKIQRLFGTP